MDPISSPRALDEWTFVDDDAEAIPVIPPTAASTSTAGDLQGEVDRTEEDAEPTPTASQDEPTPASDDVPDGFLRIRLRIGEQTRPAYFKATQGVQEFTEKFFTEELADRKRIRLIYMGMLLIQDRTMGEFGIEEGGVIHAVINDALPAAHPEASQEVVLKGLSNPANSLLLTTGLFLYGLWTLMYHYPHIFSWKAIFLLAALSAVHVSATVSRFTS